MAKPLYVVGLGPGDPELVTVKAARLLGEADLVFVPYSTGTGRSLAMRVVEAYARRARVVALGFPMGRHVDEAALRGIAETLCSEAAKAELPVFAVLGDPTLYSTFGRIRRFADCVEPIYVPGVTAATACAARAGVELALGDEAVAIVPASRLDVIRASAGLFDAVIVYKGSEGFDEAASALSGYRLVYARRCYMEGEYVGEWRPEDWHRDYFSVLIARR